MLKKLFSVFLVFSLISVQANTVSNNNLKQAFDELSYALSVEWDQQDRDFYDAQMKKFQDQIKELQKQGLSHTDLVAFAKTQVKDQKLAKDLESAFNMIQINKMDQNEARKLVLDIMSKGYKQGASWRGEVAVYTTIAVVLVAAIVLASVFGSGVVVVGGGCQSYSQYVCYDYYDSWGYYWYTDCFYETYCW